ncbi:uncharacterized protein LOC136086976 [Hydra vulgaris]|uniref:Uncharacterized protein LOC136086976 n=1 Tax=Hydra vulgaris TaxID=6087 RepID=A0ABM4CUD4_HYDVU
MTTILRHVLNMNSTVKKACDNYIDDIFVDESVLIGHYPVVGSLRLQASYVKRLAGNIPWNEYVSEDCKEKMNELLHRLENYDSVGGKWLVPVNDKAELYCDASSIGLGVVLLIGGVVIKNAAWLRPTIDTHHINISELDSILRGLNLASKWDIKELTVYSDSKSTVGWLNAVLKEEYRVKIRGISQLLVQRRLNTIKEIAKDIKIIKDIWKVHSIGHFGVDRTLQLCLRNNQNVSRKEVSAVIACCNQCNSIDPYYVKWKYGQPSVKQNWNRVALDVSHVGAELYLSMIDCGPSRYTVWRKLVTKTAAEIIGKLEEIFSLFGPPVCLLLDNEFRSHTLAKFADEWDADLEYRAQGNGVDTRKKAEKYEVDNIFNDGDDVWVKPAQETKCDQSWIPGIVWKQNTWSFDVETANRVLPRHISHLRRRIPDSHIKIDSFNKGLDIPKDEVGNGKGRYNKDAVQVRNDSRMIATNKR